jgi:hypothetical protein
MAFFGVRLSDDLAVRFDALAARKGGRSKVLRGLIEAAAKAEGVGSAEAPQPLRSRSDKLTSGSSSRNSPICSGRRRRPACVAPNGRRLCYGSG